ncbi:MAG: hypothetical protein II625_07145 [Bacilli bacterium]|nr:hypothetical protein [Bacilli bacterium]
MYISDKCEYIPYGSDFNLDEKIDEQLKNVYDFSSNDLIEFLKNHKNYGLDVVFNFVQHYNSVGNGVKLYIAKQGYGLDKLVNDENYEVRIAVAEQGYGLDILINDKYISVRMAVAEQGYGLDKLINDKDEDIRKIVVKQGYGLDKLINDENYKVRKAVAEQGYGLDILINDEYVSVRMAVAKQGYGLDKLVYDENYEVRKAVAEQGYGLDKLINDADYRVWQAVAQKLSDLSLTIVEWYNENPDKCYYDNLKYICTEDMEDNCIDQLIDANLYLDFILKHCDSSDTRATIRHKMIDLGCSNLHDWIVKYPENAYRGED